MISRKYSKRDKRYFWGFDIRLNGQRIRDYCYEDRKTAEKVLLDLKYGPRRGTTPEEDPKPRFKELIEIKLAGIKRPNELTRSRRVLYRLLDILESEDATVEEVSYKHLKKFRDIRRTEVSESSVNRELNIISSVLHRAAIEFEELEHYNPPRIPMFPKSKKRRERILDDNERSRLLSWLQAPKAQGEHGQTAAARNRVGDILEFALLTGLRHSEILQLKWQNIDTSGQSMTVYGGKTDSTRYLPVTNRLFEIITRQKKRDQFIFNQGGQITPKFYTMLKRACNAVGIAYGARVPNGFVLHSARHTFVTRLLQAGVDLATVQSLSGHSDRTMALHYAHATEQSKRDAMNKLVMKEDNNEIQVAAKTNKR